MFQNSTTKFTLLSGITLPLMMRISLYLTNQLSSSVVNQSANVSIFSIYAVNCSASLVPEIGTVIDCNNAC